MVFNDSGHLPPVLGNVAASASYAVGGTATAHVIWHYRQRSRAYHPRLGVGVDHKGGLHSGDTLAVSTSGTSIALSYNASTGVLSLTGSDTLAHYQQVLDSVSYSSSSQDPTDFGADQTRTVSWTVNDGTLDSPTQTTTINITQARTDDIKSVQPPARYRAR